MKNTISLCMIVKNEEKYLAQCLESVKAVVDEIVIVDTGSSDKTKEIAASFGAKVYDFEWNDDFSAARNFAKSKTTMNWILQLDADEYFEQNEAQKITNAVQNSLSQALSIRIINLKTKDTTSSTHTNIRLFRNSSDISYEYCIHEQPYYKGKSIEDFEHSDISIMHLGYIKEIVDEKDKRNRNLRLLDKELKKRPHDKFIVLNIASEYLATGDYQRAIYYYQKATNNGMNTSLLQKVILKMAIAYEESRRSEEALLLLRKGQKLFPTYTDLVFLEAEILQKNTQEKQAEELFTMCLSMGEVKGDFVSRKGISTSLPLMKLGYLATKSRNFTAAVNYYSRALKEDKYSVEAAIGLFGILKYTGEQESAISFITSLHFEDTNQNKLFKYKIFSELLLKQEFINSFRTFEDVLLKKKTLHSLYYFLLQGDFSRAESIVNDFSIDVEERQLFLYLLHSFKGPTFIKDSMEKDFENDHKRPSLKVYSVLLDELSKLQMFDEFNVVLSFINHFPSTTLKTISNIFYNHLHDELALEFILAYLKDNPEDAESLLFASELLLSAEYYIDAIEHAERAFNLNNMYFKALEVILEAYLHTGELESAQSFAKHILPSYPKSTYLLKIIQG